MKFHIDNNAIEIVKDYKYLGIFFCKKWFLFNHQKIPSKKATKAMYGLLQKCRKHKLSIECQLDTFDKTILPILLYGSEIWGFENIDIIERIHLHFL